MPDVLLPGTIVRQVTSICDNLQLNGLVFLPWPWQCDCIGSGFGQQHLRCGPSEVRDIARIAEHLHKAQEKTKVYTPKQRRVLALGTFFFGTLWLSSQERPATTVATVLHSVSGWAPSLARRLQVLQYTFAFSDLDTLPTVRVREATVPEWIQTNLGQELQVSDE